MFKSTRNNCVVAITLALSTVVTISNGSSAKDDFFRFISVERGGFYRLSSVADLPDGSAWAVGWNALVRFNGGSWVLHQIFPEYMQWSRIEAKARRVYAVGSNCSLLELRDSSTFVHSIPMRCNLLDLSMTEDGEAWIVGEDFSNDRTSLIIRWKTDSWTAYSVPNVGAISAIHMFSRNLGWAIGIRGILFWNGVSWILVNPNLRSDYPISAIHGITPDEIWAVGGYTFATSPSGISRQLILHYDGENWSTWREVDDVNLGRLNDVVILNDGTGWAVGEGFNILKFDGSDWNVATSFFGLGVGQELLGVSAVDPSSVWFVGDLGMKVHWDGSSFYQMGGNRPISFSNHEGGNGVLSSISVLPSGEGWSVGSDGPILRRVGGVWTDQIDVDQGESAVSILARDEHDVWAGTNRVINGRTSMLHFDGDNWAAVPSGVDLPIWDIADAHDGRMWAVASSPETHRDRMEAAILAYSDSAGWRISNNLEHHVLRGISSNPTGGTWAVGSVILRFDGETWREVKIDNSLDAFYWDVNVPGDGRVLIAGARNIYEFDGVRWFRHEVKPNHSQDAFTAIAGGLNSDIWVTSREGVWVNHNQSWFEVSVPCVSPSYPCMFSDIAVVPTDHTYNVWISGAYDTILMIDGAITNALSRVEITPTPSPEALPTSPTVLSYQTFMPVLFQTGPSARPMQGRIGPGPWPSALHRVPRQQPPPHHPSRPRDNRSSSHFTTSVRLKVSTR